MKVKVNDTDYIKSPRKIALEVDGKIVDFEFKKFTQNLNGNVQFIIKVPNNFPKILLKTIFGSSAEITEEENNNINNVNPIGEPIKNIQSILPIKLCILWEIYKNDNLATTHSIRNGIGNIYSRRSITQTISRMLRTKLLIRKCHATYAISEDYFPTAERIFKKLSRIFGFKIF